MVRPGVASFRRYGMAEKSLFGLPGPPEGLLVTGGQKPHFRAKKGAWRTLDAIPSSGMNGRKLRAVGTDLVAKVSDRF